MFTAIWLRDLSGKTKQVTFPDLASYVSCLNFVLSMKTASVFFQHEPVSGSLEVLIKAEEAENEKFLAFFQLFPGVKVKHH